MIVGPFRLVDPPEGQAEVIRATVEAIDYPWERLAPALAADPDGAVLVEWADTGQGVSGLFYGASLRIVLSTRVYHLGPESGFVFAHEVGHLIDRATLRDEDRQALMDLVHASPATYRDDAKGQTFNGGWWPLAHANPHAEKWVSSNPYNLRHNEAYADLFVRAFAPTVWDGAYLDGAPAKTDNWLRFVHATHDLDAVRSLTLWHEPEPDPRDPEPEVDATPRVDPKEPAVPPLRVKVRRQRQRLRNLRQRVKRLRRRVRRLRRQ